MLDWRRATVARKLSQTLLSGVPYAHRQTQAVSTATASRYSKASHLWISLLGTESHTHTDNSK